MEDYIERYIQMANNHPELSKGLPREVCNAIYNSIYNYCTNNEEVFSYLDKVAWTNFFSERINEYEEPRQKYDYYLLDEIGRGNCIKNFSIIEFLLREIEKLGKEKNEVINSFADELNQNFERINYGYRIIGTQIVPITDTTELNSINEAKKKVSDNVREHLDSAISCLSDTTNPNYRNSIKESISAVEALCYKFTGKNEVGKAVYELSKNKSIHPKLKELFQKLYEYSNDKDTGIRHSRAIDETDNIPTYYEARFILVTCTAFINYINGMFSNYKELSST